MALRDFKILLDKPSDTPVLGFQEYAVGLENLLRTGEPRFVVGIFGGWGTGKTTLMRMVREKLTQTSDVTTVEFNAWRYEREEHLIVPLLDVIREALSHIKTDNAVLDTAAKKAAGMFGRIARTLAAGLSVKAAVPMVGELTFDGKKALSEQKAENDADNPASFYHASFCQLRKTVDELCTALRDHRVVVFIDDLDRCLPEGALSVLESMKLFFDLPGFIFVVGLDRRVVETCIDARYRKEWGTPEERDIIGIRGEDYIKKIFQVPFALSPVDKTKLEAFLEHGLGDLPPEQGGLPPQQKDEINGLVRLHLEYLVAEEGINPREVKRLINAYTLNLLMDAPDLSQENGGFTEEQKNILMSLHTLAFRRDWQETREFLLAFGQVFIDALKRETGGEKNALLNLGWHVPATFIEYVQQGPANVLLDVSDISPYLRRTERTDREPRHLPLLQKIAGLREFVRRVDGDEEAAAVLKELADAVSAASSHLSDAGEPLARRVSQQIESLQNRVRAALRDPSLQDDAKERAAWIDGTNELIDEALQDAHLLYKAA